jgi:hypothetical protein
MITMMRMRMRMATTMIYRRMSKYLPTQYAAFQPDRLIIQRYEVEAIKGYEIRGKGEKKVKFIVSTAIFCYS